MAQKAAEEKGGSENEYERACDKAILPDMDWFTWKTATPEEMGDMNRHPPYGRELEDWRKNTDLNEYKNFEDLPKEAI